eukprot:scaffold26648_cov15-Prasinocladus_malaysianus.AAC.1
MAVDVIAARATVMYTYGHTWPVYCRHTTSFLILRPDFGLVIVTARSVNNITYWALKLVAQHFGDHRLLVR